MGVMSGRDAKQRGRRDDEEAALAHHEDELIRSEAFEAEHRSERLEQDRELLEQRLRDQVLGAVDRAGAEVRLRDIQGSLRDARTAAKELHTDLRIAYVGHTRSHAEEAWVNARLEQLGALIDALEAASGAPADG